jgi:hypothetical protein
MRTFIHAELVSVSHTKHFHFQQKKTAHNLRIIKFPMGIIKLSEHF